ncbi:MAG: hypothetical protein AAFV53_08960 [Myxococcota bacterium]
MLPSVVLGLALFAVAPPMAHAADGGDDEDTPAYILSLAAQAKPIQVDHKTGVVSGTLLGSNFRDDKLLIDVIEFEMRPLSKAEFEQLRKDGLSVLDRASALGSFLDEAVTPSFEKKKADSAVALFADSKGRMGMINTAVLSSHTRHVGKGGDDLGDWLYAGKAGLKAVEGASKVVGGVQSGNLSLVWSGLGDIYGGLRAIWGVFWNGDDKDFNDEVPGGSSAAWGGIVDALIALFSLEFGDLEEDPNSGENNQGSGQADQANPDTPDGAEQVADDPNNTSETEDCADGDEDCTSGGEEGEDETEGEGEGEGDGDGEDVGESGTTTPQGGDDDMADPEAMAAFSALMIQLGLDPNPHEDGLMSEKACPSGWCVGPEGDAFLFITQIRLPCDTFGVCQEPADASLYDVDILESWGECIGGRCITGGAQRTMSLEAFDLDEIGDAVQQGLANPDVSW